MASTAALYTPQVLGLATRLADFPLADALTLRGSARSPACGSTVELGLQLDADGRIARIGLKAQACAIGQAAAAIFATAAQGRDRAAIVDALAAIELWLRGDGEWPVWPDLGILASAREFPGRHGAILLAWRAARDVLPMAEEGR